MMIQKVIPLAGLGGAIHESPLQPVQFGGAVRRIRISRKMGQDYSIIVWRRREGRGEKLEVPGPGESILSWFSDILRKSKGPGGE